MTTPSEPSRGATQMTQNATLEHVTSKDGTTIAYDKTGRGPAVVFVSGGSADRMSNAGHPEEAAEYFMAEVVRMPPDFVAWAKSQPFFAGQVKIAHTLVYDAKAMGDYLVPTDEAKGVQTPTLVIAGGADFPFMPETA